MDALAMFPLGGVLFPYTPLVLRVFEPLYLTMIGRLLDDPDPEFGVVLIERGFKAGGGDERAPGDGADRAARHDSRVDARISAGGVKG